MPTPLRHSLLRTGGALVLTAAWLYWSLTHTGWIYRQVLSVTDPHQARLGWGVALGGSAFWVLGVIPYVTGMLLALGAPPPRIDVLALPPTPAAPPDPQLVLIERIRLSAAEAQARGLASPVIVERLHYAPRKDGCA
jgi:hypothetical protein